MRYDRQIRVKSFGQDGQDALRKAHVLMIGAGGLAAPALQYLVGAGLGRITLIDPDVVSESNLHRQTLFAMTDIGQPKVDVAQKRMAGLNPECAITALKDAFTPANADALCAQATLVLDCADSFAVSYIASDACVKNAVPFISASVTETSGYCGGFCASAPDLRAVFPDLPNQLGSCATSGVLGPCVGVIGSVQAQMALSVLTKQSPSPLGQLVNFDAQGFRFSSFRFDGCEATEVFPRFIAKEEVDTKDYITDLRGAEELGPMLPSAHRLNLAHITQDLSLNENKRLIFACRTGLRAWRAAQKLKHPHPEHIFLLALGEH